LDVEQSNAEAADLYASAGAFAPAATRAAIAALDASVLVLADEMDSGPLPRVAAAIAQMFPKAELSVQPDAGHFP
jgi:pimeloyl-ACP methyl ester carboxylesterase